MEQSPSVFLGECGKIEESGDVIHVQQMHFVRPPRETHRDDGHAREARIPLPRLEGYGSEEIVLAKHHVGAKLPRYLDRVGDSHDAGGLDTQLPKELSEVIAEIAMPPDTQCLQCCSLSTRVAFLDRLRR